jgi:hypothetical protein
MPKIVVEHFPLPHPTLYDEYVKMTQYYNIGDRIKKISNDHFYDLSKEAEYEVADIKPGSNNKQLLKVRRVSGWGGTEEPGSYYKAAHFTLVKAALEVDVPVASAELALVAAPPVAVYEVVGKNYNHVGVYPSMMDAKKIVEGRLKSQPSKTFALFNFSALAEVKMPPVLYTYLES